MEESCQWTDKYYRINDSSFLIGVNHPDETYIIGILDVKAIRGCMRILGYRLTPNSPAVKVYSIREFGILKINSMENNDAEEVGQCDEPYLRSLNIPSNVTKEIVRKQFQFTHIYLVRHNEDAKNFISYLRPYSFPGFAKEAVENLMINPIEFEEKCKFVENKEWNFVVHEIMRTPKKVVLCGGVNVGKSTLLRYLVNRSLEKWSEILVLDFDPGQSEFTVMGCLSAILIKNPLLGPNFSHLIKPDACFYLGDISVVNCIELYVTGVENIVAFCQEKYQHIPWFINTMGFTKDVGIKLLNRIIRNVKPDDVVQINANNKQYDFPEPVSPEFLSRFDSDSYCWKYNLHLISSVLGISSKQNNYVVQGLEPITKRNVVTMSYFRSAIETTKNCDILGTIPQKLRMDKVDIIIRKPSSTDLKMSLTKSQKLCCINANIVALCSGNSEQIHRCEGFGIIRGFDFDSKEIFIITPLTSEELDTITVIQMSSRIQLPLILYKAQISRVSGACSYMTYNKRPDKLSQQIKRTFSRLKYADTNDSTNNSRC